MAPDGTDHELIENNVITTEATDGYPWPIILGADDGSTIRHNTSPDGDCEFNIRCGTVRIYGGNPGIPSEDTVIKDNVVGDIQVDTGSTPAEEDYNLIANAAGSGAHDIKGLSTFAGGSTPTTWAGFALTALSLGRGDASDSLDRGAAIP